MILKYAAYDFMFTYFILFFTSNNLFVYLFNKGNSLEFWRFIGYWHFMHVTR